MANFILMDLLSHQVMITINQNRRLKLLRKLSHIGDPIQQKVHDVYFWENWDICII